MKCTHFGLCGGCLFQDVSYQEELGEKDRQVKEIFSFLNLPFKPIIPSPLSWEYRNKMEFTFRDNLKGERFLGLYGKKGRVVSLKECFISPPWFIAALKRVYDWWEKEGIEAYFPPRDKGTLRTLTLREGTKTLQKMVLITISGHQQYPLPKKSEERLVETLSSLLSDNDTIVIRKQILEKGVATRFEENIVWGKGYIEELLEREGRVLKFKIKPSSFFQPNTWQAEALYKTALSLLSQEEILFDLYCGTGTMGMFASSFVKKVVGIEINREAALDAMANIENNNITNMEIFPGSVEEFSHALKPDAIIIDPPRSGLTKQAMKNILNLGAKKIIYISCNPLTQKENTLEFMEKGYTPYFMQSFDQFPHTSHIENIIAFDKTF